MTKLSVCIEMFWEGLKPEEKISRIRKLGFGAFEFWGWKDKNLDALRAEKEKAGVAVAAFCLSTAAPLTKFRREAELTDGMKESVAAARQLDCGRLIAVTGNAVPGESFATTRKRVLRGMRALARIAEDEGITLVLEPLNTLVDHPGYWLTRSPDAASLVEEVGSPRLKILFDIYHQQITEGNILSNISRHLSSIGHFHAAGVPGRHELAGGELDYRNIFAAVAKTNYDGFIGLEFSPTRSDEEALAEALSLSQR